MQQNHSMSRLTTAQASAVPIPAPATPNRGISSALKMTSRTHMAAFRILGVSISPQHCRNAELMETSCENGIISE